MDSVRIRGGRTEKARKHMETFKMFRKEYIKNNKLIFEDGALAPTGRYESNGEREKEDSDSFLELSEREKYHFDN